MLRASAGSRREPGEGHGPRFHFNVYDGAGFPDEEGTELPDRHHARAEALRYASDLLRDEGVRSAIAERWHREVTDTHGAVLFRPDFTIVDAAGPTRPPAG